MSQFAKFSPFVSLGLFLLLVMPGCSPSSALDAKALTSHRTRLALAEEPDGVQTVANVRLALLGESEGNPKEGNPEIDAHEDHDHDGDGHGHEDHALQDHGQATEAQEVVMVGHIGGLANPWVETRPEFPFDKTQARFYLADPQAIVDHEESGHSHAPGEECSFCAAHAEDRADMLAVVQFLDKKGDVLPTDVRQLFDVKEHDTVVVIGKAHITAGGILVIDAQGLYIRR